MHCYQVNTCYRSENPWAVCVFVSPVLISSSTNRLVDHFHPKWYLSHLPAGIFYCMLLRKIIMQRNFLCLWGKIIWKASLAHRNFSISRKICCVKLGFQILYAVEQFSSLFSKDKLQHVKQEAHIHQTYDPPSLHMSWENCCAVPSQQLPHVLCWTGT